MNFNITQRQIENNTVQTVNARELHGALGVGRDFSTWIKGRIERYGFKEDYDFVISSKLEEFMFDSTVLVNQTCVRGGDRKSIEYHVSLDMAKELAMVENNEKGRQARRYFIEAEKQFKQQLVLESTPLEQEMRAIDIIAKALRVAESSKVQMYKSYCEKNAPRLLSVIPSYAIDAPVVAGVSAESSEATAPISVIIKELPITAQRANVYLQRSGLLEKLTRKSSKGTKEYWSVTEDGLEYGKNITSPANQRETQPHWYISSSEKLKKIILDEIMLK